MTSKIDFECPDFMIFDAIVPSQPSEKHFATFDFFVKMKLASIAWISMSLSKFGYSRLQEHECRMMARGKPVQPVVGAGFCPGHWDF